MAHVELSVTEPLVPMQPSPELVPVPAPPMPEPVPVPPSPDLVPVPPELRRWCVAVDGATEPCLVVDGLSRIVAASARACELLGLGEPAMSFGLSLFAGVLRLLDFTATGAPLSDGELEKIPPVLAVSSGRLARALMRVRSGCEVVTVDAIATPLFDGAKVVGSLTFLLPI